MRTSMFYAKLHRARVTGADIHYEGSIGIDADLMEAAGMVPFSCIVRHRETKRVW